MGDPVKRTAEDLPGFDDLLPWQKAAARAYLDIGVLHLHPGVRAGRTHFMKVLEAWIDDGHIIIYPDWRPYVNPNLPPNLEITND